MNCARAFFWCALLAGSSGCVVVPTPELDSGRARENINESSLASLQPGVSTTESVMLTLGEPDAASPDERRLVYRSEKIAAVGVALTGPGEAYKDRYLELEFTEQGVLSNRNVLAHWIHPISPDAVLDIAPPLALPLLNDTNRSLATGPAAITGRVNWIQIDKRPKDENIGPEVQVSAQLELGESALRLRGQNRTSHVEWTWILPYQSLKECRVVHRGGLPWVVIQTRDDRIHWFSFVIGDDPHISVRAKTESAAEFIRARVKG